MLEKVAREEVNFLLVAPFGQRGLGFSPAVEVVSGNSTEAATSRGPVVSALVVDATSECDVPASYSMAAVRQQAEEAGLSSRAA